MINGGEIMIELSKKELLRPDEVSEILSISKSTVYMWVNSGMLSAVKFGESKTIRIPTVNVRKIMKPAFEL